MRTDPNAKSSQQVASQTKSPGNLVDGDEQGGFKINYKLSDGATADAVKNPISFQLVKKFFRAIAGAVAGGFSSACSAIQHAFLGSDQAEAALRHIKKTGTVRALTQTQTQNIHNNSSSTNHFPAGEVDPDDAPLKLEEKKEVAKRPSEPFDHFIYWSQWKYSKKLPEGESIDLDAAKTYANSYITKFNKAEYAGTRVVQKTISAAKDLIQNFESDKACILEAEKVKPSEKQKVNLAEPKNSKKMSSPPPPRILANGPSSSQAPLVGAVRIPTTKAVDIAIGALGLNPADIALIGSLVLPHINSAMQEQIVYDALPFLERLQGDDFDPMLAANALKLAQYWNDAKGNPTTLSQLQTLPSFAILDKLSDLKTTMWQIPSLS